MTVVVFGAGAVGHQINQELLNTHSFRVIRRRLTAAAVGYELVPGDIAVLATPCGTHLEFAAAAISAGAHVVSTSDSVEEVLGLLQMDAAAQDAQVSVLVGAGFVPGLSCLLVRHGTAELDKIDGISVSKHGTGGPACARQHHLAFKQSSTDWLDGQFESRAAGSGRDLVWFPEPIGGKDCYRASLASPILLQRMFGSAERITARVSGTRRDRLTSRLPMLRKPHADGGPGAVRVEIRGQNQGAYETVILGVAAAPSTATAVVASVAATNIADGNCIPGARGLAEQGDPVPWLKAIRAGGLKIETFSGV